MPTSFKQHIKIACIGCSYTEGLRANEVKSYPFLLYKKLKQDYNKNVEVYNCGVGGSGAKVHKHIFEYVRNSGFVNFSSGTLLAHNQFV